MSKNTTVHTNNAELLQLTKQRSECRRRLSISHLFLHCGVQPCEQRLHLPVLWLLVVQVPGVPVGLLNPAQGLQGLAAPEEGLRVRRRLIQHCVWGWGSENCECDIGEMDWNGISSIVRERKGIK